MKTIKIISLLLFVVIIFSSCEKKYHVSKVFIDETTQKPISGLLVGLYKFNRLSWDTPIDSLNLISTAKTDTAGRVTFEVIDDDFEFTISSHLFLPVNTSDSLSVNAKFHYQVKMERYPLAGWDLNEKIEMSPYYHVILRLKDYTGDHTLKVKYGNQNQLLRYSEYPFFDIILRPGEEYKLQFYKTLNSEDVFVEEKTVYVKYLESEKKYLFDLPYSTIDLKL